MDSAAGRSLHQQPQRPQSLFVPPVAIPLQLQRLQPQKQPFTFSESDKFLTTQHNHQYLPHVPEPNAKQSSLTSKGGRSSPYPQALISSEKQCPKNQHHPQIWCGKGQTEPSNSKYVYNYAQRKESIEKTPMCRVAELARYNKLRHEYALLDESGPAHKKKFIVKLSLCHGQEFEGSGPSIKKAQQSAAQCALDSTTLPKPPQMRGVRRSGKKDESNSSSPILLLNSIAAQLGINVHYREESIRPPGFSPPNLPVMQSLPPIFPQLCYTPHPLFAQNLAKLSPNKGLVSILDLTLNSQAIGATPSLPLAFSPFQMVDSPLNTCLSPSTMPLFLPGSPSAMNGSSLLGQYSIQNVSYKVTIKLSLDGSEHIGMNSNIVIAKQKAASLALAHLKPELERFKRTNEQSSSSAIDKQQLEDINKHQNHLTSPQSGRSSSSTIESESPSFTPNNGKEGETSYKDGKSNNEDMIKNQQQLVVAEQPRPRRKTKSVVSQIHECALRLRMNVEFEVLAETGEPHNRVYTIRCRLSSPPTLGFNAGGFKEYLAEGQGPSKKAAKQATCQQLLDQVRHLVDNDPIQLAAQIVRQTEAVHHRTSNGGINGQRGGIKEFGKRKTIVKDKKMDPEYGHHINPISRLIQVMQVRQEREPNFQLIAEQGQNRHKEFIVEVQCMDLHEQGTGPNKKLAKRAAAEAMLARIGYVKQMPQPGKSLLKKKGGQNGVDFMEIGHFDATNENNWIGEWQTEKGGNQQRIDTMETFADVEQEMHKELGGSEEAAVLSPPPTMTMAENSPENETTINSQSPQEDELLMPSQRRRVTFNAVVSACPPPDDSDYPASTIAPLKSELGGRLKRRSRDSQRVLGEEEMKKLTESVKLFLSWPSAEKEKKGIVELDESEWHAMDGMETIGIGMDEMELAEKVSMEPPTLLTSPPPRLLAPSPIALLHTMPFPSSKSLMPAGFSLPILPPPSLLPLANHLQFSSNCQKPNLLPMPAGTLENATKAFSDDKKGRKNKLAFLNAKTFLERMAKQFKFTVAYSDFPKTKNAAGEEQCFTLLTLGLAKPIVCHGSGATEEDAHTDAAFNAIRNSLSQLDRPLSTT